MTKHQFLKSMNLNSVFQSQCMRYIVFQRLMKLNSAFTKSTSLNLLFEVNELEFNFSKSMHLNYTFSKVNEFELKFRWQSQRI